MRIISEKRIRDFWAIHPDSREVLQTWILTLRSADWSKFSDVRETFNSADLYRKCVVFNVGGNNYRVIGMVEFKKHLIFIRFVLRHDDYDKDKWKSDCES
jgi:mRNA interferase HigB